MSKLGAVRVLLADDQALVRSGFRMLLDAAPAVEVVGEAGDGAQALSLARRLRPDIVMMDIRMPVIDGLEATRQIAADRSLSETRVLIVTTFAMDEYVFEAVRAGASGFVVKDIEPEDLLGAIRVVAAGDALLSPPVTRTLIAEFARQARRGAAAVPGMADLTEREREVLKLVAGGRTNAEIGSELFMSPATAKTHVSRILSKLDARDRAQLVVIAYESGVVSPGG